MTTITKEDFMAYEDVRSSGATNMFAINVVESMSGLTREKVLLIMSQYSALKETFGK